MDEVFSHMINSNDRRFDVDSIKHIPRWTDEYQYIGQSQKRTPHEIEYDPSSEDHFENLIRNLDDLKLPDDQPWTEFRLKSKDVPDNNLLLHQAHDPDSGIIANGWADNNKDKNSKGKGEEGGIQDGKILSWSELTFQQWDDIARPLQKTSGLKYIFQMNIANGPTSDLIEGLFKKYNWNTKEMKTAVYANADEREAVSALAGSPLGNGIQYMLKDHAGALGKKQVGKVHIWHRDNDSDFGLAFELEAAP
jgi:hypothetical protein